MNNSLRSRQYRREVVKKYPKFAFSSYEHLVTVITAECSIEHRELYCFTEFREYTFPLGITVTHWLPSRSLNLANWARKLLNHRPNINGIFGIQISDYGNTTFSHAYFIILKFLGLLGECFRQGYIGTKIQCFVDDLKRIHIQDLIFVGPRMN